MKQILLIEDNTAVRENTAELLELKRPPQFPLYFLLQKQKRQN
jgi:CheY-like chemotaxis protein